MNLIPTAVVWDETKTHHFCVFLDPGHGVVRIICFDCDVSIDYPASSEAEVIEALRSAKGVQVVLWLVHHE